MKFKVYLLGLFLLFALNSANCQSKKMLVRTLTGVKLLDLTGPIPVIGPQIAGFGGGSAEEELNIMTDLSNNILFMTASDNSNVIKVLTSAYTQMPNGLIRGDGSSLESAICKIPCTTDQFYFFNFVMDAATMRDSLFYSIIDMSLNGGLGDVTQKNVYMGSGFKEGMSISHQARNGCRWLLISGFDSSNNFYVKEFKISNSGVTGPTILDTYPMVAAINNPHELELSGDNLKMCVSTFSPNPSDADMLLYDFDLESGTISNRQLLNVSNQIVLGLEFSPDATKIYYQTNTTNISTLGRYDLTTATNQIIDNTRTRYQSDPELGGNGRIYIGGNYVESYLSEIADPNNPNVANIQYTRNAYLVDVAGCRPGLTNTIDGEPIGTSIVPNQIDFTFLALPGCNEFQFLDSTCLGTWHKWDFGDGQISYDENPIHQFQTPGTYSVNLRVLICSDTLSITHNVNSTLSIPTLSVSPDIDLCRGDSTVLTISGAQSYLWSPTISLTSSVDSVVIAFPSATTTYTVTGTTSSGCTTTSTVTVSTVIADVEIIPVGDTIFCTGNSVILNGSGTSQYLWSNGSTSSTISPITSGWYYLEGIESGCRDLDSINIIVNPLPNLIVSGSPSVTTCNGIPVTVQAYGASSYLWTPSSGLNSTTDSIVIANPINSTVYTVTGTNSFGCTNSVTLSVNPAIANVNLTASSDTIVCNGNVVNLFASGTTQYLWSDGSTGQSISVTTSGTYYVQGIENGCIDIDTINVVVNPVPNLALSVPPSIIICNNTSASIAVFGASSYIWAPSNGLSSTTDSVVVANPISETTYTVTGTNSFGCSASATVNIIPSDVNASILASGPINFCSGDSVNLNAGGGIQYQWSTGQSSAAITVTSSGSYHVFVSDGSCLDSTSISVTVNPTPSLTLSIQPTAEFCNGDSALITFNANSIVSKEWYLENLLIPGITSDSLFAHVAGLYTVVVENNFGCTNSDSIVINVLQTPNADFAAPEISCSAFISFSNNSTNSNSYLWNFPNNNHSVLSNPTYIFPDTGTYSVTLIARNNFCIDSSTIDITIGNTPFAGFNFDTICGLTRTFQNISVGGLDYLWDFGDGDSSSVSDPIHNYSSQGNYDVKLYASDTRGCTDSIEKTIALIDNIAADFDFVFDSCSKIITFTPINANAGNYFWNFGDGNTSSNAYTQHSYSTPGEYEVNLITNYGTKCSQQFLTELLIEKTAEKHLYIPNTFTPNVDGLNEFFEIMGMENCYDYKLVIFNRWGEIIFETINLNNFWNGEFKGEKVESGIYPYLLYINEKSMEGKIFVLY